MKTSSAPVYNMLNFTDPSAVGDFYCSDLATHLKDFPFLDLPHRQDFFLSILFTGGRGIHEIDFNAYQVGEGNISMVGPGQLHNWKFSNDIEGFIFMHTSAFYDLNFNFKKVRNFPFFCSIHNTPFIKLNANEYTYFVNLYQLILNEYIRNDLMSRSKICSLIDITYTEATRLFIPGRERKRVHDPYLLRFMQLEEFVNKHYKELKSPTAYAELLHLTERHLNRICKHTVNKTLSDVIHERIMLEAKRMLARGDKRITEIAEELGYDDTAYFSRLFKNKCGISASAFMKHYRSQTK